MNEAVSVEQRIQACIDEHPVVLFMKGTADFPQCGFSGLAVHLLRSCDVQPHTVNVLEDPEVREGIKQFSQWPTVPQLYIKGEFIGGSDIMKNLFESGELKALLRF